MNSNGVIMFSNSMVSSSPRVAEQLERVSALSTLKRYNDNDGHTYIFVIKSYSLRYQYINLLRSRDGSIHVCSFA